MNVNVGNPLVRLVLNQIQHYNHEKYWEMRKHVIDVNSKMPKIVRLFYLLRIKRMDAFHNASMGTDLGRGCQFASPPIFDHGLNGIIISHYAKIGNNCRINQRVTIAQDNNKPVAATIGDNCFIGAGAAIIGDVKIGNNVTIGANAVVIKDIPDNCIAVGVPAKIIPKNQ
ncbi:serine acetyltransferase [Bacillus sp. 1P10SD]|uniref:serine O-acetyltransferase n=1 Tax=Bacillus sp. 1P10SD TaxID=3132265 RepID=UPI0039A59F0D